MVPHIDLYFLFHLFRWMKTELFVCVSMHLCMCVHECVWMPVCVWWGGQGTCHSGCVEVRRQLQALVLTFHLVCDRCSHSIGQASWPASFHCFSFPVSCLDTGILGCAPRPSFVSVLILWTLVLTHEWQASYPQSSISSYLRNVFYDCLLKFLFMNTLYLSSYL